MSWIQNFFQKLRKEEEEKITDYILHKESGEQVSTNQYDSIKDLDARIAYQYPKGGHITPKSERLNQAPRPKKLNQAPIAEKLNQRQGKKRSKRLEDLPNKSSLVENPKITTELPTIHTNTKEQKSRPRGPFQPTEIPSPVFGFNRPQKITAVVEHELSRFLDDELDVLLEKGYETKHHLADDTINNEQVEITHHRDHNRIIQTTVVVEGTIPPVQGDTNSVQAIEPIFEISYPAVADEGSEKKNLAEADEISFVDNVVTEGDMYPLERVDNQVVVREISSEEHQQVSMNTLPFGIEDSHAGQTEEIVEERSKVETSSPTRSRLPFNVMMLKQDKQKWEERKRKREYEQELLGQKAKTEEKEVPVKERPSMIEQVQNEEQHDGLYVLPKTNLLSPPVTEVLDSAWIEGQKELLNQTLKNFNVGASVVNVTQGPSVTRFEVQPEPGVKVNKITNLSDDIKLSLAARDIRIEAPIPGKHTIGIEVPNQKSRPVLINEIIGSKVFKESASPLTAVLGLDIAGKPIVTDLKKMPHGLIAGATGSGKSVCINSILISLLYKARPEELKLLLIDPKMVELAPYNSIPHLVSPVITDVKAATAALKWAVDEMERRYELFAHTGVRDINRFNELAVHHKRYSDKLPFIVIIIDELADLMMMSPADVEEAICRIAQKARACGIHLIVATQRPSVDVITGLIKANIPTRIAFSVSSQVDSRTIIDISGAERLLGRGDMLFLENGASKPVRLQGTFVSDDEIDLVVAHVREQQEPDYLFEQEELLKKAQITEDEDELFYDACEFIVNNGGASTSSLQRRFKIGYNRAARLMDMLEQNGYITGANGSKAREVLITEADLQAMQD
ncbi:DNA translocase FtsK [Neobacillus cucumis]|uniref:DNA translocase FtsK n=1 Tax=Neobacillus cucumis TaxID=1740721 RepID=UPI002155F757|nr:DNA translocase FtsK [Neobacillus cucumis]